MPTFALPRFIETHIERSAHARKLEQVVRDADENVKSRRYVETAADGLTLRGIPCLSRGVGGAIAGSRPESVCYRL